MGKKKQHLQQSMSQMVSNSALAKLGPHIEKYVNNQIRSLGMQLATQQASTLETLFSRVVVLESILMEKYGLTEDYLSNKVADLEDSKQGLSKVDEVQKGDTVRIEVSTKSKDQEEFQGTSRLKVSNAGSGENLGQELEDALISMKTGETKLVEFGEDKLMQAKIKMDRISRGVSSGTESKG
jgi:uncharacterized coiled-coil protein SlyX